MPTFAPPFRASRGNYMPRSCVQAVEMLCLDPLLEYILCTNQVTRRAASQAKARTFTHIVRSVCTCSTHPNHTYLPLLFRLFSPLSTSPITTTTNTI